MKATIITADRYIVADITSGIARVVQSNGLCTPCKWHANHGRLESCAINVTDQTKVPAMYNYNASVKAACAKHNWRAMSLAECQAEVARF